MKRRRREEEERRWERDGCESLRVRAVDVGYEVYVNTFGMQLRPRYRRPSAQSITVSLGSLVTGTPRVRDARRLTAILQVNIRCNSIHYLIGTANLRALIRK